MRKGGRVKIETDTGILDDEVGARCLECSWWCTEGLVRRRAHYHAKTRGHSVLVRRETTWRIDPAEGETGSSDE